MREKMYLHGLLALALAVSGCVHGDDRGVSLDPDEFIATAQLPDDLRLEQGLDADGLADLLAYLRQHDH